MRGRSHYNFEAPPGHWRPKHRRQITTMPVRTIFEMPDFTKEDHDGFKRPVGIKDMNIVIGERVSQVSPPKVKKVHAKKINRRLVARFNK